eukprot:1164047-Pleurochrysis_carterae.AAC.1
MQPNKVLPVIPVLWAEQERCRLRALSSRQAAAARDSCLRICARSQAIALPGDWLAVEGETQTNTVFLETGRAPHKHAHARTRTRTHARAQHTARTRARVLTHAAIARAHVTSRPRRSNSTVQFLYLEISVRVFMGDTHKAFTADLSPSAMHH